MRVIHLATNLNGFIFSILLIGHKVLGDSFIRHVIDLFDVSGTRFSHTIIPEFGASHVWLIVDQCNLLF